MNLLAAALALLNGTPLGSRTVGQTILVPRSNTVEIARLSRKAFDTDIERITVWRAAGQRCEWWTSPTTRCEATFPEPRHCQLDHFMPRQPKYGLPGATDLSNCAALCPSCNNRKSNRKPPRWMRDKIVAERRKLRTVKVV